MHAGDARMLLYVPAVQIEHEEEPSSEENVPEARCQHRKTRRLLVQLDKVKYFGTF